MSKLFVATIFCTSVCILFCVIPKAHTTSTNSNLEALQLRLAVLNDTLTTLVSTIKIIIFCCFLEV